MNFDFLQHPEEMTDRELEGEYQAVNSARFDELINDDEISYQVKQDLLEHKWEVEQEQKKRENGEWVYPLYAFNIFDF